MERGEISCSNLPGSNIWAKLMPLDSLYSDIELISNEMTILSEIKNSSCEKQECCRIIRNKDQVSALMQNKSSHSITDDDTIVQKDDSTTIRCAGEIILGPEDYGYMRYMFKVMPAKEIRKKELKIILDPKHTKCSICLNVWHDVVTVPPCLHNFWCQEKHANILCPQCRAVVQFVGRNHFLHSIEEDILESDASLRRSSEDQVLLDSYASIRSPFIPSICRNRSEGETALTRTNIFLRELAPMASMMRMMLKI